MHWVEVVRPGEDFEAARERLEIGRVRADAYVGLAGLNGGEYVRGLLEFHDGAVLRRVVARAHHSSAPDDVGRVHARDGDFLAYEGLHSFIVEVRPRVDGHTAGDVAAEDAEVRALCDEGQRRGGAERYGDVDLASLERAERVCRVCERHELHRDAFFFVDALLYGDEAEDIARRGVIRHLDGSRSRERRGGKGHKHGHSQNTNTLDHFSFLLTYC